jgi:hypothetical protein
MNHNLTVGHMDTTLVAERGSTVLRPLDDRVVERHLNALGSREEDRWTLGGGRVEFRGGCVIAAWWVGGDRNRAAEEFAIRLQRETGCQIIDREHGRIVEAEQLEGCSWIGLPENLARTGAGRFPIDWSQSWTGWGSID